MTLATIPSGGNREHALLRLLFGDAPGNVFVTALGQGKPLRPQKLIGRDLQDITDFAERWDEPGRALYFCVATLKPGAHERSREALEALCAAHCDIDFKDLPPEWPEERVLATLHALKYPPSSIVASGHGFHCYWRFATPLSATPENIALVERINKRLAVILNGDEQAYDTPRLLRLPGTHNWKNPDDPADALEREQSGAAVEPGALWAWLINTPKAIASGWQPPGRAMNGNGAAPHDDPYAAFGATLEGGQSAFAGMSTAEVFATIEAAQQGHVHMAQISAIGCLLVRGLPDDEVAAGALKATLTHPHANSEKVEIHRIWQAIRGSHNDPKWGPIIAEKQAAAAPLPVQPQPVPGDEAIPGLGFRFLADIIAAPYTPIDWQVEDLIYRQGVGILSGFTGAYKTFLALNLAAAVATGTPFANGRQTKQGAVLYVAAEGGQGIADRLRGLVRYFLADIPEQPIVVLDHGIDFKTDKAVRIFLDSIPALNAQCQARYGVPISLVIFDTLAKMANFKDEKDNSEISAMVRRFYAVSAACKAFVLFIDHHGHTADRPRGASSKMSDVDVILTSVETDGGWALHIEKVKDAASDNDIPFRTIPVDIKDIDGEPLKPTLGIEWIRTTRDEPTARKPIGKGLGSRNRLCDILRRGAATLINDGQCQPYTVGKHTVKVVKTDDLVTWFLAKGTSKKYARAEAEKRVSRALDETPAMFTIYNLGVVSAFYLSRDEDEKIG